jgi:hypothetical protein
MSNLLKNKLSFAELEKRANDIATTELLKSISGGLENACHDDDDRDVRPPYPTHPCTGNA